MLFECKARFLNPSYRFELLDNCLLVHKLKNNDIVHAESVHYEDILSIHLVKVTSDCTVKIMTSSEQTFLYNSHPYTSGLNRISKAPLFIEFTNQFFKKMREKHPNVKLYQGSNYVFSWGVLVVFLSIALGGGAIYGIELLKQLLLIEGIVGYTFYFVLCIPVTFILLSLPLLRCGPKKLKSLRTVSSDWIPLDRDILFVDDEGA